MAILHKRSGHEIKKFAALLLIIIVGFSFRIYRIGEDNLWNDELGQLYASTQPTLIGIFQAIQKHVMAMPLDYLMTRLVSYISVSDFMLRVPSLIWSTASLIVFFFFCKKITNYSVALIATFLLSVSPIHIQYAQEMRFYSALLFFFLMTTYLLITALERPSLRLFYLFIIVSGIGIYFHPYVIFSLINGMIYLLFLTNFKVEIKEDKRWLWLVLGGFLLLLIFTPGYIYFGNSRQYHFDLLRYGDSLSQIVLTGVGFSVLKYTPNTVQFGVQFMLLSVLFLLGIALAIAQSKKYKRTFPFLISGILQIVLIIGANYYKGYFFVPRQIIHVAPFFMIYAAVGIFEWPNLFIKSTKMKMITMIFLCVFVFFATTINTIEYYEKPKSNMREIAAMLEGLVKNDDIVYVIPDYEVYLYHFLVNELPETSAEIEINGTNWNSIKEFVETSNNFDIFLVAPIPEAKKNDPLLKELGFTPIFVPDKNAGGLRSIYLLESNSNN